MKKYIGITLILAGLIVFIFVLYINSEYSAQTRAFSPYTLLRSSWEKYKIQFISKDGRIIDYTQDAITTSEGQSYAMLRAVWMDDKETFDSVWKWTRENLKRPNDHLSGWKWGKREDESYGFIKDGGENNASDADSDIALALLLAGNRWSEPKYKEEARIILNDLWKLNVADANGKRYLIAGNWAQNNEELVINPSYFSPYAWKIFAQADPEHDWNSLVDPGYALLTEATVSPLDKKTSIGLPPDWVTVERQSGKLRASSLSHLTTNYSFDAIRVPWRIALDYQWNRDQRAYDYLATMKTLSEMYKQNNSTLGNSYSHDGTILNSVENPTMYSTALGYFIVHDPESAKKIYQEKVLGLYSTDKNSFRESLPYYEQNWLWFGVALYNESLYPYTQ